MIDPIVRLRDVFCVHRTNEGDAAALQGMNLELEHGELLCVLGPSGAGKSTLLRVVAGMQVPSAGIVQVLEQDIGRTSARARARLRHREIGFVGQSSDDTFAPDLRVRQAIELPLALRGVEAAARRTRARELLESAGLSNRADALPRELSGGERQRVAVCAAVAHRPALLLADEPTGELDAASAETVRALITDLARADGASVLIVSHDPDTASAAGRTVRIRDGRVVEDNRDGQTALVIGRGGWLRLPSDLLAGAGIGDRAQVHAVPGALIVTGAGAGAPARTGSRGAGDQCSARGAGDPCPTGGAGDPCSTAGAGDPCPTGGAGDPRPSHGTSARNWTPARVELRAIERAYASGHARRHVLADLTLAFEPGRMTALTGRSGAGKTTLLRLLCGLDRPDAGELAIDGQPLAGAGPEELAEFRRARIGYLPQEPWPVGFLSAEENVALALRIRGWDHGESAERATTVLIRVGLADRARQRVARLSAGEAQRVALARALASARGLLVVDEPTSRLDEAHSGAVAELLVQAAAEDRQTVICATHDPEVIRHADHVVALG
jgi:ABC-type lipoprotein export system ATPase subunit